jgi:hypothetical protein
VDIYKDNKNLHTSVFMKIVMHCKLNKYNTINNCTDTSAYYNILPLVYKELYYIADSNSDRGISINHFKNKDINTDDSENEDIGTNDSKDKDIGVDDFKDKDISANNSKNKDISTNNSENKNVGVDDSTGENDLD